MDELLVPTRDQLSAIFLPEEVEGPSHHLKDDIDECQAERKSVSQKSLQFSSSFPNFSRLAMQVLLVGGFVYGLTRAHAYEHSKPVVSDEQHKGVLPGGSISIPNTTTLDLDGQPGGTVITQPSSITQLTSFQSQTLSQSDDEDDKSQTESEDDSVWCNKALFNTVRMADERCCPRHPVGKMFCLCGLASCCCLGIGLCQHGCSVFYVWLALARSMFAEDPRTTDTQTTPITPTTMQQVLDECQQWFVKQGPQKAQELIVNLSRMQGDGTEPNLKFDEEYPVECFQAEGHVYEVVHHVSTARGFINPVLSLVQDGTTIAVRRANKSTMLSPAAISNLMEVLNPKP